MSEQQKLNSLNEALIKALEEQIVLLKKRIEKLQK